MPAQYEDWKKKYLHPILRGEQIGPYYSDVEPIEEQKVREQMIRHLIDRKLEQQRRKGKFVPKKEEPFKLPPWMFEGIFELSDLKLLKEIFT